MDPFLNGLLQQHLQRRKGAVALTSTEEDKDHDLLSFLSIVLDACDRYNAATILLGVLMASDVYTSQSKGEYFQISILPPREVLFAIPKEDHPVLLDEGEKMLELVAVKSPIIIGPRNSPRNRQIWSAMVTELGILKNPHLEKHENIVRLLGVCWQPAADSTPMPALILEAAEMDLDKFLVGGRPTSLPQVLKLAVQITSGVEAIHAVGVIHGDIKPQNLLIFRKGENLWTAKIADFGSSLIRAGIKGRIHVQFGSRFWQAPEISRPLLAEELEKADIFSLGMVLWRILSLNSLTSDLEKQAHSQETSAVEAKLEDLKQSGNLATLALTSVKSALSAVDIPGFDDDDDDYTMALHLAGIVGLSLGPAHARQEASFILSNLYRAHDFWESEDAMDILIQTILGQRRGRGGYSQATKLAVIEVDQIPNMVNHSGTLRTLPRNLYQRIIDELKDVALHSENVKRRADAAFEYSLHLLDTIQICPETQSTLDEALELLLQAAIQNVGSCRNVVGWWFAAFGKPIPLLLEQERSWLFEGTLSGSETASRRLELIDARWHSEAAYRLRSERGGVGLRIPNYSDLLYLCDTIDRIDSYEEAMRDITNSTLEFAAMTGYKTALTKLLERRPNLDLNGTGPLNTTPLLRACVAGHLDIVMQLLEHGADPTIASTDGTTPLHYLSSFPDEHITAAAEALVRAGAPLEARSPSGAAVKPPSDSYLRVARGTPLSFATAAANLPAVRALISHGADPFDVVGEAVAPGDRFNEMMHTSPVVLASTNHLSDILKALLASQDAVKVRAFLRPRVVVVGPRPSLHRTSCLAWAVDYHTRGLRRRVRSNGAQFREAFAKTFDVLVRHGADPFDVDGDRTTVLGSAIPHGQPYVVDFLMKWRDGLLINDPTEWIVCLGRAAVSQDKIIFNAFLQQQPAGAGPRSDSWLEYFVAVCKSSNDTSFLTPFEAKLSPNADGTDMLWAAMEKGHLDVASWVYGRTNIDFARRKDGESMLGHLILYAKKYVEMRRAVAHFLTLEGLPDSVFYDVATISGSSLTALQMAAYYFEYEGGASMANSVLQLVLERWDAPLFLNHQVQQGEFRGSTAIMIAARTVNSVGLQYLLNEVGDELDLGLLDAKAYNVYDRAILNLSSQNRSMDWMEIPTWYRETADLSHWERSLKILRAVDNECPRPNRMLRAVVRTETEVFCFFEFTPKLEMKPWRFPGGVWPASALARDPIFVTISQLDVGSAAYSKRPHLSDEEIEASTVSTTGAAGSGERACKEEEEQAEDLQREVERLHLATSPETQ